MKIWSPSLGAVHLQEKSFVAQGGQGRVYAHAGQAIKLYHPQATVLPEAKFHELATIQDDCVIRPQELVRQRKGGRIIGYAMRLIRDSFALCQLFPKSFRQRKGLDPSAMMQLVLQLKARIESVHAEGSLLVDINDMNFLVDQHLKTVFAIDCDNFQTPSFPAAAASPSTRDPLTVHGKAFSQASDWYAFAIVAFQMLIGVHPYRGKHPAGGKLMERMRHHRSLFSPGASLPPVALNLDVIPAQFRAWLHAVLEEGTRSAPPQHLNAARIRPRRRNNRRPIQPTSLRIETILQAPDTIVDAVANKHGELFVACKDGVYDGQKRRLFGEATHNTTLALSPQGRPLLLGPERFWDLRRKQSLKNPTQAERFVRCGDAIWALAGSHLVELQLVDVGSSVVASARQLAFVAPHGTRLFDGLAVQSLLGSCHFLLPLKGGCTQLRVSELDGKRVVAAVYRRGVAIVYVAEQGMLRALQLQLQRRTGPTLRYVLSDLGLTDSPHLDLVVLANGLAVVRQHADLRVFDRLPHRPAQQRIHEEQLREGGWFFPNQNQLLWCNDNQVLWLQSAAAAA